MTARFRTGPFEHVLLAGVSYDDTHYEGATGFDFTPIGIYDYATEQPRLSFGATPPLTTFLESAYKTLAGYAQIHASWGERVHLLAGGRLSRYTLTEIKGGQGTDDTVNRFDPRIGVTVALSESVSAFAGWSTGSRLSLFFASADGAPPELETSRSLEGGLKFSTGHWGLSGTLAGFRIVRENVPAPDPASFITSIQTGEQRSIGVEGDLVCEPNPRVSVLLSAAYTNSDVTEDITIPSESGLPRVPVYSGRMAARYRFTGVLEGLGVGAGVTWASEAELTLPNSF